MNRFSQKRFIIILIPFLILFGISFRNALFWDTIQFAGDHPNWYYTTHFKYLLLPDECDSGHPPAFGMYIASIWFLLGRSIEASHLAMLPFIIIIVYQAVQLGYKLIPQSQLWSLILTLIILTECVLVTQTTLVSPELWLIACFLTALNAILSNNNKGLLTLTILGLGLISSRGMMVAVCLYIASCIANYQRYNSVSTLLWQQIKPFLLGGAVALAYFCYHYYQKGWIGYHEGMTWARGFDIVPFKKMVYQCGILVWRLIDYGKILTVMSCGILVLLFLIQKIKITPSAQQTFRAMLILGLLLGCFTALPLVRYQGLLTHRYLLPLNLIIGICTIMLLYYSKLKFKKGIACIIILTQLSGHFWHYPDRISQGWENTLSHLPYYNMRKDFINYMASKNIAPEQVSTAAMMTPSAYQTDILQDSSRYRFYDTNELSPYIWYANVANELNQELPLIIQQYDTLKYDKKGYVTMILFQKKP
jgi:hypothetical protein